MARTSKTEAPRSVDEPMIEARYVDLGSYTVAFETHKMETDPAPLFRGLPDDRCQCPHWGVVVSGKVVYRYADREETYVAGDAYYGEPGHLPLMFPDTELIEFSPTDALNATMAVVSANIAATNAG
jgi:hypothetical protein